MILLEYYGINFLTMFDGPKIIGTARTKVNNLEREPSAPRTSYKRNISEPRCFD